MGRPRHRHCVEKYFYKLNLVHSSCCAGCKRQHKPWLMLRAYCFERTTRCLWQREATLNDRNTSSSRDIATVNRARVNPRNSLPLVSTTPPYEKKTVVLADSVYHTWSFARCANDHHTDTNYYAKNSVSAHDHTRRRLETATSTRRRHLQIRQHSFNMFTHAPPCSVGSSAGSTSGPPTALPSAARIPGATSLTPRYLPGSAFLPPSTG